MVNVLEPLSPSGSAVRMNLTGPSTSILASEITSVGSFLSLLCLTFRGASENTVNGVRCGVLRSSPSWKESILDLFLGPETDFLDNSSDASTFDNEWRCQPKPPIRLQDRQNWLLCVLSLLGFAPLNKLSTSSAPDISSDPLKYLHMIARSVYHMKPRPPD